MELIIAGRRCRTNSLSAFKKLENFIKFNKIPDNASENDVRKELLKFVEGNLNPNEWLLYDGNSVWNVSRLIKQFKTFVKYYDVKHFPKYLYEFFHLQCGSIAHYNKEGWLSTYSTIKKLKEFFEWNEYGLPVRNYPPSWHYDARLAAEQMSQYLSTVKE